MSTLAVILCMSFVLCVAITPILRGVALRCGLVDRPDGDRKVHPGSVPVAGGVAVFMSICAVLGTARFMTHSLSDDLSEQTRFLVGLLLAGITICLVGLADDWLGLRARYKLLGQIVAVGLVMSAGLMVRTIRLFHWELDLGLLAVPFTAFWLLGAINSLNLIDGMDGLLGSLGLIICLAMGGMAVLGQHWAMAAVAVAMGGALLGFLRFNFPPASIFLGDSGSMLIGLVVGFLGIQCSLKAPATIALAAPLAIMTIPILDTILAITRRKLTGRSIYATDRGHLHHCLLRHGLSNRRALMLVATLCLVTVVGTLTSLLLSNELVAVLSALAVVVMLIVTRLFGHAEMLLIMNRVWSTAANFMRFKPGGPGRASEVRLQGSVGWNELWRN